MISENMTKIFQLTGAALAIPAAAAGSYSTYRSYFSAEAACDALRSTIMATIERRIPSDIQRGLLRKDVAQFESKCAKIDPAAVSVFQAALESSAPAANTSKPSTFETSNWFNTLVGTYIRQPIANNWHIGSIVQDSNGLHWTNKAGQVWKLTLDQSALKLHTGPDNPYYSKGWPDIDVIVDEGRVAAIRINGERYTRQ